MSQPHDLELASLPREQIGPFLILGLDKDADEDTVQAHWAERLKSARRRQIPLTLEDINWARAVLLDAEQRLSAELNSLSLDLYDRPLARLASEFGVPDGKSMPRWEPLLPSSDLATYEPAVEPPSAASVHAAIALPEIPADFPAVSEWLAELAATPLDPWATEPAGPVGADDASHDSAHHASSNRQAPNANDL